jgi:hypothetical protein
VGSYLESLTAALDLVDWHVEIDWDAVADDDADAQVLLTDGRRAATVQLGRTFAHLGADDQRRVLLHELLHLHTHLLSAAVHKGAETRKGSGAYLAVFDLLEETMVDTLAVVLGRLVPAIPWPAPDPPEAAATGGPVCPALPAGTATTGPVSGTSGCAGPGILACGEGPRRGLGGGDPN